MPDERSLRPLLARLADNPGGGEFDGWHATLVTGGAITSSTGPHVRRAKWRFKLSTIRDEWDRAGREGRAALAALQRAGLDIVPAPLLLYRDTYGQPVIVETWMQGEGLAEPPATETDWLRLAEHLITVHRIGRGLARSGVPSCGDQREHFRGRGAEGVRRGQPIAGRGKAARRGEVDRAPRRHELPVLARAGADVVPVRSECDELHPQAGAVGLGGLGEFGLGRSGL